MRCQGVLFRTLINDLKSLIGIIKKNLNSQKDEMNKKVEKDFSRSTNFRLLCEINEKKIILAKIIIKKCIWKLIWQFDSLTWENIWVSSINQIIEWNEKKESSVLNSDKKNKTFAWTKNLSERQRKEDHRGVNWCWKSEYFFKDILFKSWSLSSERKFDYINFTFWISNLRPIPSMLEKQQKYWKYSLNWKFPINIKMRLKKVRLEFLFLQKKGESMLKLIFQKELKIKLSTLFFRGKETLFFENRLQWIIADFDHSSDLFSLRNASRNLVTEEKNFWIDKLLREKMFYININFLEFPSLLILNFREIHFQTLVEINFSSPFRL